MELDFIHGLRRKRKLWYIFSSFLQYVEKLEKILRFVIKEKALSLQDLDNIWAAQVDKENSTLFCFQAIGRTET